MKYFILLVTLVFTQLVSAQTVTLNKYVEENLTGAAKEAFFLELANRNITSDDLEGVVLTPDKETGHLVVLGDENKHSKEMLVFLGIQVGSFFPKAFEAVGSIRRDGRPWIDTNVRIEPSSMMQSYSLGAAIHIKRTGFLLGAQVRDFRLAPSSDPFYDPELDRHLALSAELGYRNAFGANKRWMASFTVGATYVPNQNVSLPVMYNVNVGVGYRIFKKKL